MSSLETYRIETEQFVVTVDVDISDKVIHCARYVWRFRGQPFSNLLSWAKFRFKHVKVHKLEKDGTITEIDVDKRAEKIGSR